MTEGTLPLRADATVDTVAMTAGVDQAPPVTASAANSTGGRESTISPAAWSEPVARALHGEEVHRARGWTLAVMVLAAAGLSFLPLLPGALAMKLAFAAAVLTLGATAAWVWHRTRDEARYTRAVFRTFGYVAATSSFVVEYYLGVFSPTPLVVTLGITFFGMGMDRRHALLVPLYAIAGYLTIATLITLGVLEDRGVLAATNAPLIAKVFFVALAPLVLSATLWMARVSRRSMAEAMHRASDAMRLAGEREAQLFEARQNLEELLRAGAGHGGRFTGTRAGHYELNEVIGRGAMGEVYAANDTRRNLPAAVKLLRLDAVDTPTAIARFFREGEIAQSLDVPNVVRVYDVGRAGEGLPYIAMELLAGEDLAAILRRERQLSSDAAAELARQVARGLGAAHEAGIVHRDLKPQNLFAHRDVGGDSTWKILDFGVSKLRNSSGTLTQAGLVGTPGYMAPEQARGGAMDHRCDLFALGAVLYRSITGRPPFSGNDMPDILFAVVYRMPVRPSLLVDGLSRDVDRALALALAKDPADRFASAEELAAAFASAVEARLPSALRHRAEAVLERLDWESLP